MDSPFREDGKALFRTLKGVYSGMSKRMIRPTVRDTGYLMQTSRALRWKAALDSHSRARFVFFVI
jgi:hypothetical protein